MRAHAERLVLSQDGLQREFFISFVNVPSITKLRHLMARHLGQLVCFAGAPGITICQLRSYTSSAISSAEYCCCRSYVSHLLLHGCGPRLHERTLRGLHSRPINVCEV